MSKQNKRQCHGSCCYPTYRAAKTALNRSRHSATPQRNRPIRVYRCDECGQWHMTSSRSSGYRLEVQK